MITYDDEGIDLSNRCPLHREVVSVADGLGDSLLIYMCSRCNFLHGLENAFYYHPIDPETSMLKMSLSPWKPSSRTLKMYIDMRNHVYCAECDRIYTDMGRQFGHDWHTYPLCPIHRGLVCSECEGQGNFNPKGIKYESLPEMMQAKVSCISCKGTGRSPKGQVHFDSL